MHKYLLISFLGIFLLSISSCETDDICTEPTTPQLIICFYDVANPTQKLAINSLKVWAEGKDTIYKGVTTDSIAVPLRNTEDLTTYKFSAANLVDEVTITYQRNEVFVSRSCGYKFIYQNMNGTNLTSNWIKQIEIINPTVENEKNAHLKILH